MNQNYSGMGLNNMNMQNQFNPYNTGYSYQTMNNNVNNNNPNNNRANSNNFGKSNFTPFDM